MRRLATGITAVSFIGLGFAAPVWADQQGYYDKGQPDNQHASMTSVAGTKASFEITSLLTDPAAIDARGQVQQASISYPDVFTPQPVSPISAVRAGIASERVETGEWSYPANWEHDQKWHATTRVTVTFAAPVQDPTLDLWSTATAFRNHELIDQDVTLATSVSGYRWRLTDVISSRGTSVDPTIAASGSQITAGSLRLTNNGTEPTLTPTPIRNQIPYLSFGGYGFYCGTKEDTGEFNGSDLIKARYPKIAFSGGICASARLDTNGEAITSLTYEIDQTFASADVDGNTWNHASFTGMFTQPVFAQELSGVNTPESLGVASHAVSDIRIGSDIVAAQGDKISDALLSATAESNSDAGYVAETELVRTPLNTADTGTYTVKVPYSNATRSAYLNGWIDFNGNSRWEAGESATPVAIQPGASGAGTAELAFALPAGKILPSKGAVARFRIADKLADVQSPTGYASSGEVEDHRFPIALSGGLEIQKTVTAVKDASGKTVDKAVVGGTIDYQITTTNTSNYPMTGVKVTDTRLTDLACTPSNPADLAPGKTITCTGTYTVTQNDIDTGHVPNTATATGEWDPDVPFTPTDHPITPAQDDTDTPTDQRSGLSLVKSADDAELGSPTKVGDKVKFSFAVTNTGTATLSNVRVADPLKGLSQITYTWPNPARPGVLTAGQQAIGTATYTVTQADIDAGHVANVSTATGTDPSDKPVPGIDPSTDEPESRTDTPVVQALGLSLTKSADATKVTSPPRPGQQITYRFTVTNTGSVTATKVKVTDRLKGLSPITYEWPNGARPGVLSPGETATGTATYAITASDIGAGGVKNVAWASGNGPSDEPVTSDPREVWTQMRQVPVDAPLVRAGGAVEGSKGGIQAALVITMILAASGTHLVRRATRGNIH